MRIKNGNLHIHHRLRLKKRFLNEGLKNFEPHNILELLLFFGIPQGDTNEIAHILLNEFGSVSAVLDAPYDRLTKISGVGEHTATLLKLLPDIFSFYTKEKLDNSTKKKFTVDDAANYLVPLYLTCQKEVVRALYFDNGMNLVSEAVIHEGDVSSATFSYREMVRIAVERNTPNIIISHNHPGGLPLPSMEDMETTIKMREIFRSFGIELVEHILVAGEKYVKIIEAIEKGVYNDQRDSVRPRVGIRCKLH